ncbi:virulence protein [Ferrigenium kumadai]|uniref:Virulence protein n=1 Tax=Ferrigenium kumadai TaxID=1682490 RepID=A0AAN1SYK2_9PROT|nr:virulence factor family protein [Ferrigenium kumadai]BBI99430.1 virulence protein [Ferrigenium kumadai]
MTRTLTAAALLLFLITSRAFASGVMESTDSFGPFGTLHIYKSSEQPKHVTLFISGDGGWNLGVIDMARSLAELDSMVVGIDITHYIKRLNAGSEKCAYPAAHFEALSQYLQKKYRFPHYTLPVLVGYSSGATMVYATFAQSPPNTFAGGISMGFCPDLKTAKPFCKGSGSLTGTYDSKLGFIYQPVPALASKLYVMQGDVDRVCSTPDTKAFLNRINGAELIELAKVGHGFSVQKNWMPQFRDAFQKISVVRPPPMTPVHVTDELSDLPLVVLPATGKSDTLAVMVSGDGGWAGIDKQVAEALNKDGIAVVGLNSLQYFWEKKDPGIAGKDLARILDHYSKAWGAEKFILVGYSSGADTLPFMTSRLPDSLQSRVKVVALLGPGKEANFEFHVSEWLFNIDSPYKVIPEMQKLKGMNVLCIYGEDENDSACKPLDRKDFAVIEMKGGHHFSGDYEKLADTILTHAR